MKRIKYLLFILLVVALLWPTTAFAKDPFEDKVIFGGTFTLASGDSFDGSIVVFGGAITTEADTTVNGDVVLIGGTAEINGTVNGNLVGMGGAVRVNEGAVVNGDLVTFGATLNRAEGARITGQVVDGMNIPFDFTVPSDMGNIEVPNAPVAPVAPNVNVKVNNPFLNMVWFFFRTFLWAALAVLLVMFFSTQADRVNKAAISQPVITGGAGLLTAILAPLALIALTITIILIPVTLVAVLALAVAWLFGWVSLGLEVGRRMAKMLNMEWAPAISAGIGTFALSLVLGGFSELIHCVGWIPQTLVGLWALGAVIVTRFGTQDYPLEPLATETAPLLEESGQPEVIVETRLVDDKPEDETIPDEPDPDPESQDE
jgi:hypothetical protein